MRKGANIEFVALGDYSGSIPVRDMAYSCQILGSPPNSIITVHLPTYTPKHCSLDLLVN